MTPPRVVLLPGLHGTTNLFDRFVAAAPRDLSLLLQPLPNDTLLGYRELTEWISARLPAEPVVLVAESFSGPLALLVADRCPNVVAVALCVTFVVPPAPAVLARIPRAIWGVTPPGRLVRAFLTGGDRAFAAEVRNVVAGLRADVIAKRISESVHVDARAELERFARPLMCLSAKQDWIIPRKSAATIRAIKPSAHFVELNGPHMLLQTHPDEAWSHLAPFIRG